MAFVIRPAEPKDAAAVAQIRATGWRETYSSFLSEAVLAQVAPTQAGIERWANTATTSNRFVVAEVDGEVRGFALAGDAEGDDPPRPLQLFVLYQYATEHGSGSGQALLDAVLGDEPAFLWVAELNPRAQAFYRRNGFQPDGERTIEERWDNLAEIRMVR